MKSHLSHILPVWKAVEVLGEESVMRMGRALLHFRSSVTNSTAAAEKELDVAVLVESLSYRRGADLHDPDAAAPVPPDVASHWKRWLHHRYLLLDKSTLLQFAVPGSVQPHAGPAGHMGLFDCWVYALQQGPAKNNSGPQAPIQVQGQGPPAGTICFPDLLILLAVCKQYRDHKSERREKYKQERNAQETKEEEKIEGGADKEDKGDMIDEGEDPPPRTTRPSNKTAKDDKEELQHRKIIVTMAVLAYRLYDSYQKRGIVERDTIHRFLTDVHGEDSYKQPKVQALLDVVFHTDGRTQKERGRDSLSPTSSVNTLQATVTEHAFCRRILDTARPDGGHLLLDWIATLGCGWLPPQQVPASVTAYLETMQSSHPRPPLCQSYQLQESRLYEIKRRFHSLVQSSTTWTLIQGDPMSGDGSVLDSAAAAPPPGSGHGSSHSTASSSATSATSRHVIPSAAFCQALSQANEEMGAGGYLPVKLASLVFDTVLRMSSSSSSCSSSNGSQPGWGLYQVLHFGCMAVRHDITKQEDPDVPLLRFLFSMFQRTNAETSEYSSSADDPRVLSTTLVAQMLLRLIEHVRFRRRADCPPLDLEDDEEEKEESQLLDEPSLLKTTCDVSACASLGLLPPKYDGETIQLKTLVDHALAGCTAKDQMTFEEFCQWNRSSSRKEARTRLSPLMTELRLVAAVKFGIPPTLASMEIALVAEIERRHKLRFPQTDVSRRGPRGTVWYMIDADWFKAWAALVKRVAGSAEDANDGRGDPLKSRVRGLPPISNTGLLVENGSLALRSDIRWKHDYEILPPLAWSALQAWYDGGPPIFRSVVPYVDSSGSTSPHASRGKIPTENEIELYPYFVTVYLCDAASRGEARPFQQNFQLSRVSPVFVMLVQLCRELDVDPEMARLWVMANSGPDAPPGEKGEEWILSPGTNINDQRKRRGVAKDSDITLLLELKDPETGLWPRGVDGKEWTFKEKQEETIASDLGDGIVGLYNMGNTCYLNSSIQCLSHTPIFREYFTSKAYLKDINTTNPLGHEGRLAQVSAVLINSLWKRFSNTPAHQQKRVTAPGSYAPVSAPALTPKTFKDSLGRFNEHFSGNEQHDAQELLAFLLGGLSEDLNRIVNKPYIEAPDSDGRPDSELADIWWSNHLKREMSIIVALFTGQYKSLLTCRSCKYESARFEPFSVVTLPLPEDEHLSVSLVLYPLKEGVGPMKYCVRVRNDGRLRDVLTALAQILHKDEIEEEGADLLGESSQGKEVHDDEKETTEELYAQRAQSFSIVDMRDGYISKIAPNTWRLTDLQNKETGEVPLLHVYELDPVPLNGADPAIDSNLMKSMSNIKVEESKVEENKAQIGDEASDDSDEGISKTKPAFLAIAQRRSEVVSMDRLHPLAHRVFGTPLLVRIPDLQNCTGRQLYDLVSKRLKNVVPKSALRFLSANEVSAQDFDDSSTRSESEEEKRELDPLKDESETRTTTDMEIVSAGPVPRYGFRLRITTRDGRRCLTCPWYECCVGCLVPDDDSTTILIDGDSVVVDWHFAVDVATDGFGMRSVSTDSIGTQLSTPRFRKPVITVTNHSSCGPGAKKGTQAGSVTLEECLDAFAKEEKIPEAYCSRCKDFRVQTKRMSLWRLPPVVIIHLKRFQFTQHMRRKLRDLVIFPIEGLDLSRIMAPAASDAAPSKSESKQQNGSERENGESSEELKDDGRSEKLYDLYGVVHHQGALSGGHYVASLKSELDGQWRLFNDAQIYEIHARDVIDSSAYILFYIRRDVAKAQLSDFWDVRADGGLSEEDMNQLLKGRSDRCVIS